MNSNLDNVSKFYWRFPMYIKKRGEKTILETKVIYGIKKTAVYLDISVSEVRKLVREKRIPFFRIGNRLKFDLQRINLWLNEKQEMENKQLFY